MPAVFANPVPAADAPATPTVTVEDLERLRARVGELDRALGEDRGRETSLQGEVREAEQGIASAARAARNADRALSQQKQRAEEARKAQQQARQDLDQGRAALAQALRAAYVAGSPGPLQLLFQLDEAAQLARFEVDAAAVATAMSRRLETVRRRIQQLAEADLALERERREVEVRRGAAQQALAELGQSQEQRRQLLSDLRRRNADRAAELKQAQAEAQRMQKLIEDLRRALRERPMKFERGTPFASLRGRLPWPLRGELLARFGQAKAGGALRWNGLWIRSEDGTPVRAVADGRVVYVGWVQRFGLMVILDHPGEYLSLYGHLRDSSVEVGESIQAGSALATAGNSGGHEDSGLYFELRKGTDPIDPAGWLAR